MSVMQNDVRSIDFQHLDAKYLDYNACLELVIEIARRAALDYKQGIRMGYKSKTIRNFFLNFPYCIELTKETGEELLKRLEKEALAECTDENGNHVALRTIASRGRVLSDDQKELIAMGIAKDWKTKIICEIAKVSDYTVQKYRREFLKTGMVTFYTKKRKINDDDRTGNKED